MATIWRRRMILAIMSILMSSSDAKSLLRGTTRKLQTPSSFEVPLFLALHFVSGTTASFLETRDSTNDVVRHLCNAVQRQAAGVQVIAAGKDVGATVTTSDTTNECTIVDSVRAYDTGGEILGPNVFSIELHIDQVVYATTSNNTLTLEGVTRLVKNGFNRGRGGRVQFQTMLAENLAFSTVLDVEVLDQLGPPQIMEPTAAPTSILSPTKQPTLFPIVVEPTVSPTKRSTTAHPSSAPSQQVPSDSPLGYPSTSPSLSPNTLLPLVPSMTPSEEIQMAQVSSEPSSAPTSIVGAVVVTSAKTPPYVIAAILIGACSVLMACCFSVFLCRKKQQNARDQQNLLPSGGRGSDEDDSPPSRRGKTTPSTPLSTPNSKAHGVSTMPIIPNMVRLDDEHRSLAETTLGEYTAGRKPPKKKRLVEMDVTANSFEDESLYTTIGAVPRIQPGRRIDEDDDDDDIRMKDRKTSRSPPAVPVGATVLDDDTFFQMSDTGSSSQEGGSWMSPSSPMSAEIAGLVATGNPEALASEFSSNHSELRDDVDGITGANGMIAVSPLPSQKQSPRSNSSSLSTRKTDNVSAIFVLARSKDEEDPWTVDAPGIYEGSGSASSLFVRKKNYGEKSHGISADGVKSSMQEALQESPNNSENTKSMMQLLEEEDRKSSVSPISIQLWEDEDKKHRVSSDDGGPSPRTSTNDVKGHTGHSVMSPYTSRYLLGLQSPTAQRARDATLPFDGEEPHPPFAKNTRADPAPTVPIEDPLKPKNDFQSRRRNMRPHTFESPPPVSFAAGDISVLTSESLGVSEIVDDRWLHPSVTQTLGPRSTSPPDVESQGGKSHKSNNSSNSWQSQRSSKSLGSRRARKRRKGSSVASRGSHRGSWSFGSPADISLAPRSLETDLVRLELQAAPLKNTDSSKQSNVSPSPRPPGTSVKSTSKSFNKTVSSKQRIIVVAPPGKLGVVLANRHNGTGTVVSELRGSSPLHGALLPGDRLLAIDEVDVNALNVSQITALMSERSDKERRLTVATSSNTRSRTAPKGSVVASESDGSPE